MINANCMGKQLKLFDHSLFNMQDQQGWCGHYDCTIESFKYNKKMKNVQSKINILIFDN